MTQSSTTTERGVQAAPVEESAFPWPLILDFSAVEMTDDQFVKFCSDNDDLRIELSSRRELIIMPPANPSTGSQNSSLSGELYIWAKEDGTGISFDSSSGFTFPNGSMRAPDASWMLKERWESIPEYDRLRFSHIAPDFVVELRSPSDSLAMIQAKMEEYIDNGVRLGWLIDPFGRAVHVYQSGQVVQVLENPEAVSGEPVLPGFILNLSEIW